MTREEAARRFAEKAEDHYYVPKLRELYQMAAEALCEPEIVRCKDCMNWRRYGSHYDGRCEYIEHEHGVYRFVTPEDHFCEYGLRREDHEG